MPQDRKKKINYTLPTHVIARLRETGNASRYISRILDDRWRAWTDAVTQLARAGWSGGQILAACARLVDAGLVEPGEQIVLRVQRALAYFRPSSLPRTWTAAPSETDAYSLVLCAREHLAYNAAFHRAVEQLDAPAPAEQAHA